MLTWLRAMYRRVSGRDDYERALAEVEAELKALSDISLDHAKALAERMARDPDVFVAPPGPRTGSGQPAEFLGHEWFTRFPVLETIQGTVISLGSQSAEGTKVASDFDGSEYFARPDGLVVERSAFGRTSVWAPSIYHAVLRFGWQDAAEDAAARHGRPS